MHTLFSSDVKYEVVSLSCNQTQFELITHSSSAMKPVLIYVKLILYAFINILYGINLATWSIAIATSAAYINFKFNFHIHKHTYFPRRSIFTTRYIVFTIMIGHLNFLFFICSHFHFYINRTKGNLA